MNDEIGSGQLFADVLKTVLLGLMENEKTECSVDVVLAELFPDAASEVSGFKLKVTFAIEPTEG